MRHRRRESGLTVPLFVIMLVGWIWFLVNYQLQDIMSQRYRAEGAVAFAVGASGTLLLLVTSVWAWTKAGMAWAADRRSPSVDTQVYRERALWRRRGARATTWAGVAAIFLIGFSLPLMNAYQDLRLPDRYWPSGSGFGIQFDVAVEDSQADAEMLDSALNHTATLVGVDIQDDPRNYLRPESCLTPDGDRGTYWEKRLIVGAGLDPDKVNAIQEYWRSLGYSILPPPTTAEGSPLSYVEATTKSGGAIWVIHDGFNMYIGFSSGCSADSD